MRTYTTLLMCLIVGCTLAQPKEIQASQFNRITISGPFQVTLVKADKSKAEIDYRGIDASDVITDCDGDELEIKIRNRGWFDWEDKGRDRNRKHAVVTIYYTSLKAIEVREGASLKSAVPLIAERLKLKSRMGSEVTLALEVKDLVLESSMGSEVDLTGTATDFEMKANMGADVDASQLKCQNVTVSASMGANVTVFAEQELDASANFGASVNCKGNPKHKHTSGTFGADFN